MKNIEKSLNTGNNQQFYGRDYTSVNADNLCSGSGDLRFKGNLRIEEVFSGKLVVSGNLTVGKNARITGEVVVNDLFMFGYIAGTVRVNNIGIFHSESVFSGSLTAPEAEFHEGCKISGKRVIGRTIEIEAPASSKNSIFKIEGPASIPYEMTHSSL